MGKNQTPLFGTDVMEGIEKRYSEQTTHADVRQTFLDAVERGERVICPTCGRGTEIKARSIHAEMAIFLIRLVRAWKREKRWYHTRNIIGGGRDVPKKSSDSSYFVHWGLVERDGKGMYRPTPEGVEFAEGRLRVPATIRFKNNVVVERSEELIDIRHVLGKEYRLESLLGQDGG